MHKMTVIHLALLLPTALLLLSCCTSPAEKKEGVVLSAEQTGDAETLMKMALEYDNKGQFEEAVACYRKAAEQGTTSA